MYVRMFLPVCARPDHRRKTRAAHKRVAATVLVDTIPPPRLIWAVVELVFVFRLGGPTPSEAAGGRPLTERSKRDGLARGRSPHFRKIWLVGAGQLKICNACCPAGPAPVATAADQHQVNDGLVHTRTQLRHILSRPSGMPTWHCLPTGVVHSHATAIAVPLPRCFATDEDARAERAGRRLSTPLADR